MKNLLDKLKRKPGDYIIWDRTNNMWHDGHIYIYKNHKLVESYFFGGYDEDGVERPLENPYDVLERFKEKWSINELREIKGYDWR